MLDTEEGANKYSQTSIFVFFKQRDTKYCADNANTNEWIVTLLSTMVAACWKQRDTSSRVLPSKPARSITLWKFLKNFLSQQSFCHKGMNVPKIVSCLLDLICHFILNLDDDATSSFCWTIAFENYFFQVYCFTGVSSRIVVVLYLHIRGHNSLCRCSYALNAHATILADTLLPISSDEVLQGAKFRRQLDHLKTRCSSVCTSFFVSFVSYC